MCGVEAAGAVDAGAGVGGGGGQVHAAHRGAVTEVRERGAEEELMVEMSAAAAQVAAHQVLIHLFQVVGSVYGPSPDQRAKTRRQAFDPLLDAVGEELLRAGPSARHGRG